jgi:hypothetical protein
LSDLGQRPTLGGKLHFPDMLDILEFLPARTPDGDIDITDSLLAALDQVPDGKAFQPDRSEHAATIVFPSLQDGAAYVIRHPIDIPGDKNVCFTGSGPFGARIDSVRPSLPDNKLHLDTSVSPVFRSLPGRRGHVFQNLIFRGGGVSVGNEALEDTKHSVGGMTEFRSCIFTNITGGSGELKWAIKTLGPRVVGVRILNCQFVQTDRGVGVLHNACDNWIIGDNSTFVRMRGVGVEIRSSGVTVRDARFEDKLKGAGASPYIRIKGAGDFAGGLSEITGCRFGGEVGKDPVSHEALDGPPRHPIEFGAADVPIVGIMITRNRFLGRTAGGGPTDNSARHAISLAAPVQHTIVAHNHFRRYSGALIENTVGLAKSHSNLFVGNAVERQDTPNKRPFRGILSQGGESWQQLANGEE